MENFPERRKKMGGLINIKDRLSLKVDSNM